MEPADSKVINLYDFKKNDIEEKLCAVYSDVKRQSRKPSSTVNSNSSGFTVDFNNVYPQNKASIMKNLRLRAKLEMTVGERAEEAAKEGNGNVAIVKGHPIVDKVFNFNAAMDNFTVFMNGSVQHVVDSSYYRYKKYVDPVYFNDERLRCDKYTTVSCNNGTLDNTAGNKDVLTGGNGKISYECITPLCHPFLINDLIGLNSMNISFRVNLYNLFTFVRFRIPTDGSIPALTLNSSDFELIWDEVVGNATDADVEYTLSIEYPEIIKSVLSDANKDPVFGSTDTPGAPARIAYIAYNDNVNVSEMMKHSESLKFTDSDIHINGHGNVYLTSGSGDYTNYSCAIDAGYLGSFNFFNNNNTFETDLKFNNDALLLYSIKNTPSIYINTNDIFRLHSIIKTNRDNAKHGKIRVDRILIYDAQITINNGGTTMTKTIGCYGKDSQVVSPDQDMINYICDHDLAGGSIKSFINNVKNKLKETKAISKVLKSDTLKNLTSAIPGIGPFMGNILNTAGNKLEEAGYGGAMMF